MSKIHFIYGTVNSAKSTDLITKSFFMSSINFNVVNMIPRCDTRSEGIISSRTGLETRDVHVIDDTTDFDVILNKSVDVLFIDEVQFLSEKVIEKIVKLSILNNIQVFAYGLRSDFKRKIFPSVAYLLAHATDIQEMKSYCSRCKTHKSIYNAKLGKDGHIVTAGPSISPGYSYEGVCAECYEALIDSRESYQLEALIALNAIVIDKPIYVIGDIHGEFKSLTHQILSNKYSDCVIIVAGDCGVGFTSKEHLSQELSMMSKRLEKSNVEVLFLRGNHDNPVFFNDITFKEGCFRTIPDYTVIRYLDNYTKEYKHALCVGGGISIDRTDRIDADRKDRKHRSSYWGGEAMYYDEAKVEMVKRLNIETLITHVNPYISSSPSTVNYYIEKDTRLKRDLESENTVYTRLCKELVLNCGLKTVYHGHHHSNSDTRQAYVADESSYYLVDFIGLEYLKPSSKKVMVGCLNR